MAFNNRIRLPMQLHSAQFPEERNVFRKANGVVKTLSVIVRKQYELETDFFPELWHQRLKIALAHDNLTWEGENYLGGVSQDGDYQIQWPDGPIHYPTAKGECKVQVTPFDATNANCQTCEEATQLSLVDDTAGLYGVVNEDTDYTVDTKANDNICCFPAVFSLVSFNPDYLDSASIDPDTGILSIHTGSGLIAANGIVLATYRVTCPGGNYDEADVLADINGTVPGCLAPTNLRVTTIDSDTLGFTWDSPYFNFYWEIFLGSSPVGSPIQTGIAAIPTAGVFGLDPATTYYFQVRTVCYGSNSNFVGIEQITSPNNAACGQYTVEWLTGGDFGDVTSVSVEKCDGGTLVVFIPFGGSRQFCMMQTTPGNPVSFIATKPVTLVYDGLC